MGLLHVRELLFERLERGIGMMAAFDGLPESHSYHHQL